MTPSIEKTHICVGVIMGARGVRGSVKVKSFTEVARDLLSYAPLLDSKGNELQFTYVTSTPKYLVLNLQGITSPEQADTWRGVKIYASRDTFPELDEDEFYINDLIGLSAESLDGNHLGTIKAVENFGAGDILDIQGSGQSYMIPFTKACVPHIDLKKGTVIVDLSFLEDTSAPL